MVAIQHTWRRRAAAGFLTLMLAACGGGGGGDIGGSTPAAATMRAALAVNTLEVDGSTVRTVIGNYLNFQLTNTPDAGYYAGATHTGVAIETVRFNGGTSPTTADLYIAFKPGTALAEGSYDDTITVDICLDAACKQPAAGSPLTVRVRFNVKSVYQPEPGIAALTPAARAALPHDVIDAEFSKALNAVVMVSTWPDNALYLYDAASGAERKVALGKAPRAVSIGPNGLSAAVGHDALVSLVDLSAAVVSKQLSLSADTSDLVLDGEGRVHVFAPISGGTTVHSIDIASNTETVSSGSYGKVRALLHPSGQNLYEMDLDVSPSDIRNFDLGSGTAQLLWDSPYHGEYEMCGNFWFSADPALIYTGCGRSFRAPTVRRDDFVYSGTLALSTNSPNGGYRIVSLSDSAARNELALIEYGWFNCLVNDPVANACFSHLNLYDSKTGTRNTIYSFQPLKIAGTTYPQRGRFVFHANTGTLLLISQIVGNPDRASEFQLSRMP